MEEEREIGDGDEEDGEHAAVAFPFDRMTAQRFRQEFPCARRTDRRKAWFVPAARSGGASIFGMRRRKSRTDSYAQEKGREAFAFGPILSPYLGVDKGGLRFRTPSSRRLLEEIRPFARCDGDKRFGAFRSPPTASFIIIARRSKPRCSVANRAGATCRGAKGFREGAQITPPIDRAPTPTLPAAADDLPLLDRPIATAAYGIGTLDDPRVDIHLGDVGALIRSKKAAYHAILLDDDDGPTD